MTDVLTPEQRAYCMSRIHGRDTKPELNVRRMLHALGYRYRLHVTSLPGKPDLVFPARRKIILVHGCYWHRHNCRWGRVRAHTNADFWDSKLKENTRRDARICKRLRDQGWQVVVAWECQTRPERREELLVRLVEFLESK